MILSATEEAVRALLAQRTTPELLDRWELTECARDDFAREGCALGHHAAAQVIGWIIDELERRHPTVMVRWHILSEQGYAVDLPGLFRLEASLWS